MPNSLLNYAQTGGITQTPQDRPIIGRESEMIPNNAGGWGFSLDKWEKLKRFLILGSEGGTYYVSAQSLTEQNCQNLFSCIQENGKLVVEEAARVNLDNLAPKTDSQIFALAAALAKGDNETKACVRQYFNQVIRTGTHLLHFVAFLDGLGGWGPAKRSIVGNWFLNQNFDNVGYQVLKYQNRDGWTMRDVLRLSHPSPLGDFNKLGSLFNWICKKDCNSEFLPEIIQKYECFVKKYNDKLPLNERKYLVLEAIKSGLPREVLPNNMLSYPDIQRVLLEHSPIHALIRNISQVCSENDTLAASLLRNETKLRQSRVHPFALLMAQLVYLRGRGVLSSRHWNVNRTIVEALDDAYDFSFQNWTPTEKKILVGIDISNSMNMSCIGSPIACSQAALGMAITICRLEPNSECVTFNTEVRGVVNITKRSSLSSINIGSNGGTDLTAPIRWALRNNTKYDGFCILTDNETWAGSRHPTEVFAQYKRQINPNAKLVCCSMASNDANIVDPRDLSQIGCAGLDANLPSIISSFI